MPERPAQCACRSSSSVAGRNAGAREERHMVLSSYIGAKVKRREDPRLITGSSVYVDDLKLPGILHVSIVRSPYAHAKIRSIDTSAASAMPGVAAVITSKDMAKVLASEYAVQAHDESGDLAKEETDSDQINVPGVMPLASGK